jgi:hypothetical protein
VFAVFLTLGALLTASVGAWFAALFTGRMPAGLQSLLAYVVRYHAQLGAYQFVLTDRYPYTGPTLATGAVPEAPAAGPSAPEGWAPPVPPADWTTNPESV